MAVIEEIVWPISLVALGITAAIVGPKIALITRQLSSKSQRKLQALDDEYTEELEHKLKQYKTQAANYQRGPAIEGDMSEIDQILPELVQGFEQYAPKWLKPFLHNKETQQWLIKYAQEHPEKLSSIIGKMVKPKGSTGKEAAGSEALG